MATLDVGRSSDARQPCCRELGKRKPIPRVDILVLGETHEWELIEYAQDMISSGKKKALIIPGHVVSEQAGMKHCAEWLREFITEVPVEYIPAPEPYLESRQSRVTERRAG